MISYSKLLNESLELHNELNPKLWNEDNSLKPEVLNELLCIYEEFIKEIDIPLNIVDVEIVGSNASYNYNENSDIDLHIIVNSEVNYIDDDILRQFYNCKKNSFNNNYDIDIYGIPIELYIEDVKDGNATNGRYSLLKNDWVIKPVKIEYELPDITKDLTTMKNACMDILMSTDAEKVRQFLNDIYMMRKLGLAQDGEASVGNLVFKELRNMDILTQLRDKYYELRSEELSL